MFKPSPESTTHEGHTFDSYDDQIAFLMSMLAAGVEPQTIIILTPPPK